MRKQYTYERKPSRNAYLQWKNPLIKLKFTNRIT